MIVTAESSKTIAKLQRSLDDGVEDYNLLMAGNESLLAEHNELAKVHAAAVADVAALDTNIEYAEAHSVDVAAAGKKCLKDFEDKLVKDLAGPRTLYICNINRIKGLCPPMPEGEPSAMDYIRWLSAEVTSLPEASSSVNENFISATVEGTLMMARDSAGGSGAAPAPTWTLDLFDSGSSASNDTTAALVPHQKRPRKSPPLKASPKPSGVTPTKGISMPNFHFSFVLELLS
jgi:hypothetical protein